MQVKQYSAIQEKNYSLSLYQSGVKLGRSVTLVLHRYAVHKYVYYVVLMLNYNGMLCKTTNGVAYSRTFFPYMGHVRGRA